MDTVSINGSTYICCPDVAADLAISMTAAPDTVTVGDNLTYSLSVTNLGPAMASSVTVMDSLPTSLTFVSATASQGTWATNGDGQFNCALTNISVHGSATISLVVRPNSADTISNTVTVSSSVSDPNIGNNTASAVTTATPAPPMIIQQPQPQNVCPGASTTFAVAATGGGSMSFQWQTNNVDLIEGGHYFGVTSSNLTVSATDSTVLADYRCVVSNEAGSTNSAAAALTMNDTTLPTILCPPDVTVSADAGTCAATNVALGNPVTGDNCGVASVTNNAPPSYPLGTNLITWTVTDTSGNTSSCQQRVVVLDHEAPRIAWYLTNVVIAVGASCQTWMPNITGTNYILAVDNCSSVTVTQSLATNAVLSLGTNQVVLGAFDAAGNVAYCTNYIVVSGTLPPELTCVTNKTVDPGSAWSFDPPVAADACGGTNVTVTLVGVVTNGTFPAVATATWIAVDPFGNTSTCSQSVTNAVVAPPNTLVFAPAKWFPEVGVRLSLLGNATGSVALQWSGELTDPLSNWQTLTWFSNFLTSTQYLDSEATNFGKRFYRAVAP